MEIFAVAVGLRRYQFLRLCFCRSKYCYGKAPMQTFLDPAYLAREKMLDSFPTAAPGGGA